MQSPASLPADHFDELLARLPPDLDLDALARQTKAIERQRKINSGATLLRLALARGPGGLSLSETAAWASMLELAQVSDPAVKFRLDKAVGFLEAILVQLLAAKGAGPPLHWPGRVVRVCDGTIVNQPASKGTDWRIHGVFDLGRGGFSHLRLTDQHVGETLDHGLPVAGEVRIGDRNFARPRALRTLRQSSDEQADFIVRLRWKAFRLMRPDGKRFDLIGYLRDLPDERQPHEVLVHAKIGRHQPPLPLRLIVLRKTPEATAATRKQMLRAAPRQQTTVDPRSLVAAEFMMLATSLPADRYPAEQVLAAYRLRWQIELAFKRLKSLLHLDRLPTHTPAASRSWLLAHLVLTLLCDDLSQEFLDSSPSGPARRGLSSLALAHPEGRTARPAECRAGAAAARSFLSCRTARASPPGPPPKTQKTRAMLPHPGANLTHMRRRPSIHVFARADKEVVDGRDKPGHDDGATA